MDDSRGTAENIATWMREKDEYITALKAVLGQELSPSRLRVLEGKVQDEIARVRSRSSYGESLAQFQRELDDAKDDSVLLRLLYELSLGQSNVGTF